MRFVAPANILLRRAQLVLILAALIPTVLMTSLGIILIASGAGSLGLVVGTLVLALCTSAVTGYILGSIFLARGASLARVQNDYLSAVSHELRTPITSLRMFLETLRMGRVTDPEEARKCLAIMDQELVRLDGLVGRLHELSRLETGKHLSDRRPVAVADVVSDALVALDAIRLSAPLTVQTDVAPDLQVVGDRDLLLQAVTNLLSNAWKYGGEEKRIALTARAVGKNVEVVVEDNGPGVPEEERTRIFEPFERGAAAVASRETGSGLGLAIVRAIVRSHGGRVEVSSGSPGARFRIVLPQHLAIR